MDFWDFDVKYLDSIKPVDTTAAPKSAAKSDKWDSAKEDEIKDDKPAEKTQSETQETTENEQPDEQPAESESENNG